MSFGTRRARIREARYSLDREGVVVRTPRRGVYVKDYTTKELRDLYDATYRLESIALARVIRAASEAKIAELQGSVERMRGAVEAHDIPAYIQHVEAMFHDRVARSDKPGLQDFY